MGRVVGRDEVILEVERVWIYFGFLFYFVGIFMGVEQSGDRVVLQRGGFDGENVGGLEDVGEQKVRLVRSWEIDVVL